LVHFFSPLIGKEVFSARLNAERSNLKTRSDNVAGYWSNQCIDYLRKGLAAGKTCGCITGAAGTELLTPITCCPPTPIT
jgi:hypothetical protein